MSLQLSTTKQPVFKVGNMREGNAPWGDGKERIFRAYQGNESLAHRQRTGAKGEILIVNKSKLSAPEFAPSNSGVHHVPVNKVNTK